MVMVFLTASQLLSQIGSQQLALLCSGKFNINVEHELLAAVINDDDTSTYQTAHIADAQTLKTLVENTITDASKLMSGYLAERYKNGLTAQQISNSALPFIAQKLCYYELMMTPSDTAISDKKDAMQQLRDIAKGMILLADNSSQTTQRNSARIARAAPSNLLKGFGR